MADIIAPVLNMNGSDGNVLCKQLRDAGMAVREAIDATQEITVHGRDFQTQDPDLYRKAARQHTDRLQRLDSVLVEITQLHRLIRKQMRAS